jgi:hypothetical protein
MILPPLTPIFLAAQTVVAIADEIPYVDATSTCRADTAQIQASVQFCIQDEQRARARLVQEWAQFSSFDKAECGGKMESGGNSGYVELLNCLELARAAKKLPGN